ncbi:unnamed protein product [Linum tenue]|uniref:Fungal lipase-type domain-containing protein n=1 Tax=Linum tenue TaxID=586396 RepID=A0AAV0MHS5_9ROSI|nr:unnamed protein product [Linum tenue]
MLRVALHYTSTSCSLSTAATPCAPFTPLPKLGKKWSEYQGLNYWSGLLDPIDDTLRAVILRYGQFVDAAYDSFDFDPSSPAYGTCKFTRASLLSGRGFTGYRVTKFLHATCGLHLPRCRWTPSPRSTWIGYVAVCQDKDEIDRLGRRDVVIALRGTATCLEWLENLRATLTCLDDCGAGDARPMVESGFLSMYTSGTATCPSLQSTVKAEVARIMRTYGAHGEAPLSFTVAGHSLGAALATLAAHDINSTFADVPMVTVMSFGGPRVGNRSFRRRLERGGTRILRIVNSDDFITKVPGFVVDNSKNNNNNHNNRADTPWGYDEVGKELQLRSGESPYIFKRDVATCHELSTYLHLVDGLASSTCPLRATARKMFNEDFWCGKVGIF